LFEVIPVQSSVTLKQFMLPPLQGVTWCVARGARPLSTPCA